MQVCIDQGNSSVKLAVFFEDELKENFIFPKLEEGEIEQLFAKYPIKSAILSSVARRDEKIIRLLTEKTECFVELEHDTPTPIQNRYESPETLGVDRLAAVVGAHALRPQTDLLVVDIGTAITYDFIDANAVYWGGNISPGASLRFQALHNFTQKLPLVELSETDKLLGSDTQSAIACGVSHGIAFEIDGYIDALRVTYPSLSTFLTGRGAFFFANKLKNPIFANEFLVLMGLNHILRYNV